MKEQRWSSDNYLVTINFFNPISQFSREHPSFRSEEYKVEYTVEMQKNEETNHKPLESKPYICIVSLPLFSPG